MSILKLRARKETAINVKTGAALIGNDGREREQKKREMKQLNNVKIMLNL
jgi:hypothetical protein